MISLPSRQKLGSFFQSAALVSAGLFLVAAAVGCNQQMHPVSGHVKFPDGTPLKKGRIVFQGGDPNTGSWGLIRPDGSFVLGTADVDDGVPTGSYQVYIANAVTDPPPNFAGNFISRPLIDPKYMDPETSGLTYETPGLLVWEIVVEKPPR